MLLTLTQTEHPLFVLGRGWTGIERLTVGDDEELYVGLRWQTRLFLQTCSEQGLAIVFTW